MPNDEIHSTRAGRSESSGDTVTRRRAMEMRLAMMSEVERLTRGVGDVKTVVIIAANVECLVVGRGASWPSAKHSTSRVGIP